MERVVHVRVRGLNPLHCVSSYVPGVEMVCGEHSLPSFAEGGVGLGNPINNVTLMLSGSCALHLQ